MARVPVITQMKLADYLKLQKAIAEGKLTTSLYAFFNDAIIEKMQREGI